MGVTRYQRGVRDAELAYQRLRLLSAKPIHPLTVLVLGTMRAIREAASRKFLIITWILVWAHRNGKRSSFLKSNRRGRLRLRYNSAPC